MRTERKIFFLPILFVSPLCACPMGKISLATSEKREWRSGLTLACKQLTELRQLHLMLFFVISIAFESNHTADTSLPRFRPRKMTNKNATFSLMRSRHYKSGWLKIGRIWRNHVTQVWTISYSAVCRSSSCFEQQVAIFSCRRCA